MNVAHALGFAGPLLAAAGALLLAYDIARGRLRTTLKRFLDDQGQLLSDAHMTWAAKYRQLPEGHSRRDECIKEQEALARSQTEVSKQKLRRFEDEELDASVRWGVRGLILIAIGSVCQSIAAIIQP
jgi:hypothetical protein